MDGWGTGLDPTYLLSSRPAACCPRPTASGGNTDAFFCDPAYDKLYLQQQTAVQPGRARQDDRADAGDPVQGQRRHHAVQQQHPRPCAPTRCRTWCRARPNSRALYRCRAPGTAGWTPHRPEQQQRQRIRDRGVVVEQQRLERRRHRGDRGRVVVVVGDRGVRAAPPVERRRARVTTAEPRAARGRRRCRRRPGRGAPAIGRTRSSFPRYLGAKLLAAAISFLFTLVIGFVLF